jgi:putative transposase
MDKLFYMPKSYTSIWIHAIWATKSRLALIHPDIEKQVYDFIRKEFEGMGCRVKIINGMPDHIHCLFLLNPKESLMSVIKQVKGSSSRYINTEKLIEGTFMWQIGYSSFSVSKTIVPRVEEYIKRQKIHHSYQSLEDEY